MSRFRDHRLRLVQFNVENLFLYLDHYQGQDLSKVTEREWKSFSTSTIPNKPLKQVHEIAKTVLDLDADILMLCEVGGRESLANFSRYFLGDRYAPHLIEGNSDRGIDLGYLVKKDLPFTYDLISHKSRSIDFLYPHEMLSQDTGYDHLARRISHKFSRDVLELRVFEPDVSEAEPRFVCLLVHLKSQLDRNRIDPGGRDRRKAELEKLIEIYNEIDREFAGNVPIFLAGDFNGFAGTPNTDVEFEALYSKTKLKDALEWAGVPLEERYTYMQLSPRANRVGKNKQIDYLFVPPIVSKRVNKEETWSYRFKDEMGMTMVVPRNLNEKRLLPSDHYPLVLTLNPELLEGEAP